MTHRIARMAAPALGAALALSGLLAPAASPVQTATTVTKAVSTNCYQPVTSARGAKDHHDFSVEQTRAMEKRFRSDMQQKLGTSDVTAAADLATTSSAVVDVYVHVITDGTAATNISDQVIARQLAVLNAAYGGTNAGALASTPFSFNLVKTERINNARLANKVTPGSQSEKKIKANRVGDASTLNIWITGLGSSQGGQLFGWATFPSDYTRAPGMDGLMVDRRTLEGAPGAFSGYSEGDTATHEIGHWLGLYHTFQGGCTGGDEVADTAPEASPASGCPTGRDTCTAAGEDPIHNYMDYSSDPCLTQFSQGQADRMAAQWSTYRA